MRGNEEQQEWASKFEKEMDKLLIVKALSDDFWANVEPKVAVEYTWSGFANVVMKLPALRRDLAMYAKDASCWDGIKRRWMPKWVQRRWPPLVEVYDIDEITSPNGEATRYLLRVQMMTQEEWEDRLMKLMKEKDEPDDAFPASVNYGQVRR